MGDNNGHWQFICEQDKRMLEAKKKIKRRLRRTLILRRSLPRYARFRSFMLTSIIGIMMLSGLLFERMTATYPVLRLQQVIFVAFQHENESLSQGFMMFHLSTLG